MELDSPVRQDLSKKLDSPERRDLSKRSEYYGYHSIQGMKSVVATVSGYHGTERFKLIKLIAYTGANYVGAMSNSTTHLVCWTFEGKKYDLAKKLGTHVVSHCWFEDCLKEGKRLPEDPYTMQSGQEAGPILLDVPKAANVREKKKCILTAEKRILSERFNQMGDTEAIETDVGCTGVECFSWTASRFMHEHPSTSSYSATYREKERKSCNAAGGCIDDQPSRKSRRLVKKNKAMDILKNLPAVECERRHCSRKSSKGHGNLDFEFSYVDNFINGIASSSKIMPAEGVNNLSTNELFDDGTTSQYEHADHVKSEDGVCELNENQNEQPESDNDTRESVSLHKSAELSCVICWTEFCSSRGVLPCGHRFCYTCIQGWVDHMVADKKFPTCPLCKLTIACITKVEGAAPYDQKIYSQTIPCGSSHIDVCMLSDRGSSYYEQQPSDPVCCACQNREPEDLLQSCHLCRVRWIHSYCLDPPLPVWTCSDCRGLRGLLQRYR